MVILGDSITFPQLQREVDQALAAGLGITMISLNNSSSTGINF